MNDDGSLGSGERAADGKRAAGRTDFTDISTCLGCGYRLRDLLEPRCPECGRAFDKYDPESMLVPGYRRPSVVRPTPFGESMIMLGVIATFLMGGGRLSFCPAFDLAGVALWCWIAWEWARQRARIQKGTATISDEGPQWRAWVVALLALSLVMSLKHRECPHAETYGIGMWGISYSQNGPCKGGMHNGRKHITGNWWFVYLGP